jgi:hypothetical protein
MQLLRLSLKRRQKCSTAASEVKQRAAWLVSQKCLPPAPPSLERRLPTRPYESVVVWAVVQAHFRRPGGSIQPHQLARRAAQQLVHVCPPVKPVPAASLCTQSARKLGNELGCLRSLV